MVLMMCGGTRKRDVPNRYILVAVRGRTCLTTWCSRYSPCCKVNSPWQPHENLRRQQPEPGIKQKQRLVADYAPYPVPR